MAFPHALQPNASFCILLRLTCMETAMKTWLSAMALGAALTIGFSAGATGSIRGGAVHAPARANGSRHGFGFRHHFLPPTRLFHQPHFHFGAGFASHRLSLVTGGYGDYDYAADEDNYGPYDDDIDNLHFRVQEPFGPADIGRPPPGAEDDAPYDSSPMDRVEGYAPDER